MNARTSNFQRWGRFAATHPWLVIGGWAVAFAAIIALSIAFRGTFEAEFALPGTESQRARDLLDARFPARSGDTGELVFRAAAGINDAAVRERVQTILDEARTLPGVTDVASPYDSGAISADGTIAFATVRYPDESDPFGKPLAALADRHTSDTLTVEAGGPVVEHTERQGPGGSELIAVSAASVILLIAFGSIVAMGVPILTAVFSLGTAMALIGILARFVGLTEFTPSFAAMIGLGVGIDYALLVITRFREGLHNGRAVVDAVTVAINTAGRAVMFAGTVVVIAMLGLALVGVPFVGALGVASAVVVMLSVLTALTLLPAVLSIIGSRIDALAIPLLRSSETGHHESIWYRLSLAIQRRPLVFIAGGAGALLVLAIPLLSMETNFTDASNNPTSFHSRRAYDLLSEGFGPGFNGPLLVVADITQGGADRVDPLVEAIRATPRVANVMPARLNDAQDTAVFTIFPETAPQDPETNDLVHALRNDVIPAQVGESGMDVYITGRTASTIDITDRIMSRLPVFFAAVIGLSFVVLAVVFRSLVVPLTAAVMNLLSIAASYGIIVAVFQWGWFAGALGIDQTGPIETFLPMMMFAILFGLSMDYEVFLVSRIHEEYVSGAPNSRAVAMGLSTTARVITSAALIMIAVFGSFILGDERVIKEFGMGLAVAIFLDATIVRLLLVPAIMEILGTANWWLPRGLDRFLPRIDIEGSGHEHPGAQVIIPVPSKDER